MVERRGRACATSRTQKGRKLRLNNKQVEKDLIAENQRLRMEIDYLKSLNALVLEEKRTKSTSSSETKAEISVESVAIFNKKRYGYRRITKESHNNDIA